MHELEQFNQECLYAHNGLRKSHGVLSLTFDKKLAIEAQNYANIIAETKSLQHSKSEKENDYGENLSQSMKGFVNYVYSGLGATVNWYSEIRNYNFDSENQSPSNPTENFTQLIWKHSKKAGFGRARNPVNNTWYIVGRYYPPGNVKGNFEENVLPLTNPIKWERVPIVEEYLEELQLWEFSKARRHVLDSYVFAVVTLANNKGYLVKETYKSLSGDIYYESQIFDTNVTKQHTNSRHNLLMFDWKTILENFTQLIWKHSKKAGFGRARNPVNNTWYIVGRYYPPGNVKGNFEENVLPLTNPIKWERVPIVEEYLEELQLWEFSKARRHVLDSYVFAVVTLANNKGYLVKETYKSLSGDIYYESQIFDTNVTKQPRPMFEDTYLQKEQIFETNNQSALNLIKDEILQKTHVELFKKSLLERHNLYRKNYGVQKLSFDDELCKCAQRWADHLRDGCHLGFSHYKFKGSDIGENIAMKNGSLTVESAHELMDNWYNENKFYFYEMENKDIKEFGHFTQIVWKTTRKIGIGIQSNLEGYNFIVCFYYPPGNVKNKFDKMVPRLI